MRLRSVFLPAVALAASLHHPASATTIDFNSLSGAYESAFTSYTENGFTVATRTGHFYVNNGANPGFGDPAPDIFSADNLSGQTAESVVITQVGGGAFTFTSVDLTSFVVRPSYTLVGMLGSSQVYTLSGLTPTTTTPMMNDFETFNPGVNGQQVTSVVLGFSQVDPSAMAGVDLDNFVLNGASAVTPVVTPEPGSVVLLGTGVLSLCGMVRRRLRG